MRDTPTDSFCANSFHSALCISHVASDFCAAQLRIQFQMRNEVFSAFKLKVVSLAWMHAYPSIRSHTWAPETKPNSVEWNVKTNGLWNGHIFMSLMSWNVWITQLNTSPFFGRLKKETNNKRSKLIFGKNFSRWRKKTRHHRIGLKVNFLPNCWF